MCIKSCNVDDKISFNMYYTMHSVPWYRTILITPLDVRAKSDYLQYPFT